MKLKKEKETRTKSPAGFLDSEPLVKGFRIASAAHQPPAAVFLSSSPGDRRRARGRGSKGEAFVTRMRYEYPLAGAAGPSARRAQRHRQGEELRKTASRPRVIDGAPEPPRGERPHLPQAGLIDGSPTKGRSPCARDAQGSRRLSPQGMSAKARTWSRPTPATPVGRPRWTCAATPLRAGQPPPHALHVPSGTQPPLPGGRGGRPARPLARCIPGPGLPLPRTQKERGSSDAGPCASGWTTALVAPVVRQFSDSTKSLASRRNCRKFRELEN
jgi:hypothetical protein